MSTLAIATSGPNGGLALQSGDAVLQVELAAGRGRGRDVLPALQQLLEQAGAGVRDLSTLVVDVGPGSFTGVRVGVTVAKTLAWTLGLEVHAVSSLELLAAQCSGPTVVAVRDAGRGTVYHRLEREGADVVLGRSPGADLGEHMADALIVGEEAEALAQRFGWPGEALDVDPGADGLLALATAGGAGARVSAHDLAPLYLQASAPERKAAGEGA